MLGGEQAYAYLRSPNHVPPVGARIRPSIYLGHPDPSSGFRRGSLSCRAKSTASRLDRKLLRIMHPASTPVTVHPTPISFDPTESG